MNRDGTRSKPVCAVLYNPFRGLFRADIVRWHGGVDVTCLNAGVQILKGGSPAHLEATPAAHCDHWPERCYTVAWALDFRRPARGWANLQPPAPIPLAWTSSTCRHDPVWTSSSKTSHGRPPSSPSAPRLLHSAAPDSDVAHGADHPARHSAANAPPRSARRHQTATSRHRPTRGRTAPTSRGPSLASLCAASVQSLWLVQMSSAAARDVGSRRQRLHCPTVVERLQLTIAACSRPRRECQLLMARCGPQELLQWHQMRCSCSARRRTLVAPWWAHVTARIAARFKSAFSRPSARCLCCLSRL